MFNYDFIIIIGTDKLPTVLEKGQKKKREGLSKLHTTVTTTVT